MNPPLRRPLRVPGRQDPWSDPRLRMPPADVWRTMSPAERDQVEERILEALDEYREAMAEGTPHSRSKINAYKNLMDHFGRAGRRVFLATELCVLYPGEAAIVPDLLGVMDVTDPDRERNTWRVIEEGRGVDLVLEFRNLGKKHKDLVENVKDYARLGIKEYFSFDCVPKRLRGWRLPADNAGAYSQLVPQGGMLASHVLGLELGVVEGRLRFFRDQALIPSSEELVGRLQKMADDYQDRLSLAERAQEEAERARSEAERARSEAERARSEAERAQEEAERARNEAVAELSSARVAAADLVLRRLTDRGLAMTDEQRAGIVECDDLGRLLRWVERAPRAASVADLLAG